MVVEKWIEHIGEYSVVCARKQNGETSTFPMAKNLHINHILHSSSVPAGVPKAISDRAASLAIAIADALDVVGLIAIEYFLDADQQLIVNEMAPRPHNSGHYSIDTCITSQFEQHIRAIADLPFGSTALHSHGVMVNLLGDLWSNDTPDWSELLKDPRVKLHLYDKGDARVGRKMGHYTLVASDLKQAETDALSLFHTLDPANA